MAERDIRTGKEIKNKPGSFLIEVCGSPLWQRFDKIVDPFGDLLTKSFGFDVAFKGNRYNPAEEFRGFQTTNDIFNLARRTIDSVDLSYNNGHSALMTGGLFEELAYMEFYESTGVISSKEAGAYKNTLLLSSDRVDIVICLLLHPNTVINHDPIYKVIKSGHSIFKGLYTITEK